MDNWPVPNGAETIDLPTLQYIHNHKTGALIVAVVRAGAILSYATKRDLQRLTEYGKCLGLAFQIQDDILDVEYSTGTGNTQQEQVNNPLRWLHSLTLNQQNSFLCSSVTLLGPFCCF